MIVAYISSEPDRFWHADPMCGRLVHPLSLASEESLAASGLKACGLCTVGRLEGQP